MRESKFQSDVVKFLKQNGFGYWKCQQNATTPAGVSDLIFWYKSTHGFLECKRGDADPYRPGQKEFLQKQGQWCYAKSVRPSNWDRVQAELLRLKEDTDKIESMIDDGPREDDLINN